MIRALLDPVAAAVAVFDWVEDAETVFVGLIVVEGGGLELEDPEVLAVLEKGGLRV